jgi:hypothetical protein
MKVRTSDLLLFFMRRTAVIVLAAVCLSCLGSCARTPVGSGDENSPRKAERRKSQESNIPHPQDKAAPPPAQPQKSHGQDFGEEARLIYRVATCMGKAPLPPGLEPAEVEKHCAEFRPRIAKYQKHYQGKIKPFFDAVRPSGLPAIVVYPFGGGDLLSALNTYPLATEITTLSLELVGDPRRLAGLDSQNMRETLEIFRRQVSGLLSLNNSTSEVLQNAQRGELPGQLAFFITALAVHGFEPVGLRYFTFQADGGLHYLDQPEIQQLEAQSAQRRKSTWIPPDFSEAFANSELTFRRGEGERAGVLITHRHIAANLSNDSLRRHPSILKYLEKRGRVVAMTKAASYLLWNPAFTVIRQYLLDSMDFMVSESTGIPPQFARSAGFSQETYGSFQGSFLDASPEYNEEFRELWKSQPVRKLPFRYGYPDSAKAYHLLITKRENKWD